MLQCLKFIIYFHFPRLLFLRQQTKFFGQLNLEEVEFLRFITQYFMWDLRFVFQPCHGGRKGESQKFCIT